MELQHIVGNVLIKERLLRAVSSAQLSNTLLFSGSESVGKKLFALAIAEKLMYPNGISPANKKKMTDSNHADLHMFSPDGKSGMHSISAMRDLIEQVSFPPYEAAAKVFIIDDAERMLPTSSNALLKTLEEPTLDSYIFLITSRMEEILPTIISRCSKWMFNAVTDAEIEFFLHERMNIKPTEASYLASLSHGSVGRSIELATHEHTDKKRDLIINLLATHKSHSYLALVEELTLLEGIYEEETSSFEGKTQIHDATKWHKEVDLLLAQIFMWYRDLHLLKNEGDRRHLFFGDHLSELQAQDPSKLISLSTLQNRLEETKMAIQRNMKLKTALENLFLSI